MIYVNVPIGTILNKTHNLSKPKSDYTGMRNLLEIPLSRWEVVLV